MPAEQTYRVQLRFVVPAAVAAIVLIVGLWAIARPRGSVHYLQAGFTNVNQMTPGQFVTMAGRDVGEITSIRLDRQTGDAVVRLEITDDSVWPLPGGTYAIARWGSNTAYLGRYTELVAGPADAPPLPNGAVISAQQDQSAFELDQAYNIFRGRTASETQALLVRLGDTLGAEGPAIQRGVSAAPGGLNQAADLLSSLDANEYDLKTLASAGDKTLGTLNHSDSQLQTLVSAAAGTMSEFAGHTESEQQSLAEVHPSLTAADVTFSRLDGSLDTLTGLVDALRPGAPALSALARTAASTLVTLRTVAPEATETLEDGTAAAPELSALFARADTVVPAASHALGTLAPMLACLRPYTPDITGFLGTWSGFTSHYDAGGHYARTFELTVIPDLLPGTNDTPAEAVDDESNISYAFPRPPGLNDGHPYFLPQCGVTAAALNPADDPEDGR